MAGFNNSNQDFYNVFGIGKDLDLDQNKNININKNIKKQKQKRWDKKKNKFTLTNDVYNSLNKKLQTGMGRNKHKDKKQGLDKNYIYSSTTFQSYKQQAKQFAKYAKTHFPEVKNIRDVKIKHVNTYLNYLIEQDRSAWTINTAKCAIAKALDLSTTQFIETPKRERKNIMRSRYNVKMDKHISAEKEALYNKITNATGLRRKELLRLRGTDLKYSSNLGYYLDYTAKGKGTKGGRPRIILIMGKGPRETQEVVNFIKNAGKLKVFPQISKAYDNHYYRAEYAKRIYNYYAKPSNQLKKGEKYHMRGDMRGQVLDRIAMAIASEALGHGRISVIAQSYLYNL
ncbi:MAG: phage integrase N-terminal SAM-like domain-containing protein [Finegoldia magna]|nr:phage integrase N-terminal SAM-like domain-containing protein [Finegoldia magna]